MTSNQRNDVFASAAVLLAIFVSMLCGWFVIDAAGVGSMFVGQVAL